jgi:hypothetical protein
MVKTVKIIDKNILDNESYKDIKLYEDEEFYDDDGFLKYDNSWSSDYDNLTNLGYTKDQAKAWISKQRIDILFRDSSAKW